MIKDNLLPLKTLADRIRGAAASARSALDELRDHIDDLNTQRSSVVATPDDMDTIRAHVEADIAAAAHEAETFFRPHRLAFGDNRNILSIFNGQCLLKPMLAFAALAPDKLAELLLAQAPIGGIRPDVRRAKLAELERAILAAEIAEEKQCRELEEISGGHVPRRTDANPAILLAFDHELE